MPELHLRQPEFTYSTCGSFTTHRSKIQTFSETGDLKHIYENKLCSACFADDTAYSDSKYLSKKNISVKALKEKPWEIAINLKYARYQRALANVVFNFFDKKIISGRTSKKRSNLNEVLPEEL